MKGRQISSFTLCISIWLAAVLPFVCPRLAVATPFPGPDDFGYIGVPVPFNLRDISGSGTSVPLTDDQVSAAIPIPFSFKFYGIDYTQLFISSNGFVTFTPTGNDGCCSGVPLPQADVPNNLIAPFWEDLNNPQGNIRFQTLGTPGSREFVVGFYDVPHFSNGPRVTFEVILHENSNTIELQYASAPSDGDQHSIGIENADGTIGLQVAFGNVSFNNEGFLLSAAFFSDFIINKAEIKFNDDPNSDKFKVQGEFTLGPNTDGIDPANEEVVVGVGPSSMAIPAGSFMVKGNKFEFKGVVGDIDVKMKIKEVDIGVYEFKVKADGVDLTGLINPMDVSLAIGDDTGTVTVSLEGKLKFKAQREDEDDDDNDGDEDNDDD